jgi:hypothetical protein
MLDHITTHSRHWQGVLPCTAYHETHICAHQGGLYTAMKHANSHCHLVPFGQPQCTNHIAAAWYNCYR